MHFQERDIITEMRLAAVAASTTVIASAYAIFMLVTG